MDRVLQNPKMRRKRICTLVEENPGYNYQDLLKSTGFANGILSHHLKKLEKDGHVRIKRKNRMTWFFPPDSDPIQDEIIIHLRKETCRKILVLLLSKEIATFGEITQEVKKSPSTVSSTLKNLIENKVVRKIPDFKKKYSLYDFEATRNTLDRLQLTPTDSLKDRFADSFSYY